MVTLHNPDTRTNMAVLEMASYITYFTKCAIMMSNKHYQESCDQHEKFINQFVPPLMANMSTAAFVRPINQCTTSLEMTQPSGTSATKWLL
jgi:hypothetical protein